MNKIKIMTIFGTRPEAIKMAPLVKVIEEDPRFESIVTVTAQHRQMLDQVMNIFDLSADYDLNIMKDGQTLAGITSRVIKELDQILEEANPDIVLVHGDTTTTFSASIASFYHQIKIGHVEAGLRTWNKYSPFPEELNRQLTDVLADIYFAPTEMSKKNLLNEKRNVSDIYVTGNTAIDAMKYTISDQYSHSLLTDIGDKKIILVTMHRRENLGNPMKNVFKAINRIVERFDDVHVVFPMHKNPIVRKTVKETLIDCDRIHLIEPLDVVDFQNFANHSYMIMSDSGGVQEEAPSLGKPVLVLRDTTERPEGIEAGTLRLVGTSEDKVFVSAKELLEDNDIYDQMSKASNPYGDGFASQRILDAIAYSFGLTNEKPSEF
ncbi:UDP-N-acetylglucosamine 2-epimerase (non-hydrolyzing) [Enterococcus casseliflavus]|uniref:non-hydrolyzing UDP-N-acetylglucosamine 2-epimerase n=1 Tax=Enterococcus casseliflavus TaxID=37734 RepID=UPI000EAC02F6|nr:UDP-N-acetylglucosamine 2-epimerase (non-hydrolyzing) [Enterococcus casseliflavus]AYJ46310.1 UDP-N-acetylglucosamine 2-epimerase (non-hydrolyzing) [Enterococcus casseliflavus]MBX9115748.1 UDP-N-acetylglucosamine 2-epimerase (non-hydrolyzing) [Enterococcus casseliflavus]MBX9126524.1 UDP-N-acetylglucosamine 2-epimerase (non-hydrolyzing) [Enterococcus casseliflavus]MDT2979156.1 UDP-N-acetylglucosamine 2-epimerase (non-hydrolyzing) [Enterococcus casseliflavus]MDY2548904.1 UDP-N-acetylglucosamin